jgi:hypothetical protein
MLTKKALKDTYVIEEKKILDTVEKTIDEMLGSTVLSKALVGTVTVEVPYTKPLKTKILELVDRYKNEYGGAFSIIHPTNIKETSTVWKPTFTIQLQSILDE